MSDMTTHHYNGKEQYVPLYFFFFIFFFVPSLNTVGDSSKLTENATKIPGLEPGMLHDQHLEP